MAKKIVYSNYRVEVEPCAMVGFSRQAYKHETMLADCEELKRQIRRHVDDCGAITIMFTSEAVCEHCGYRWEEGRPECCDKAQAEYDAMVERACDGASKAAETSLDQRHVIRAALEAALSTNKGQT